MIVVTAGTLEYLPIIEAQARKCREFGYEHRVYDLGGLGIGIRHEVSPSDFVPRVNGDSLPPATFKAALMARVMLEADQNELVCWLDADCLPLREFSPPGIMGGFDVAVTLRSAGEIGLSNNPALDYLNSGVVMIRNTRGGRRFCTAWHLGSVEENTDQGALNNCVAPKWTPLLWIKVNPGEVVIAPCGAAVLILGAMEWNCWHLPPKPDTRILHFKRGIRNAAKDYIDR